MEHFDAADPPRCPANKQRGRGTFANDRPPVLGVIGPESGTIRLRVVQDTKTSASPSAASRRQSVDFPEPEGPETR